MAIAAASAETFQPSRLAEMESRKFEELFKDFIEPGKLLARQRSAILRAVGAHISRWPSSEWEIWMKTRRVNLSGAEGLYAWLDRVPVFAEDPVKKKTRVLVHQLLAYRLIEVDDPSHVAPAIDYHLMRLYVRTGRVTPADKEQFDRLTEDAVQRVEPITDLRKAVEEAMYFTASGARMRIDQLNHVEWQLARSLCIRDCPRCTSGPLPSKPLDESVSSLVEQSGGVCPLSQACAAFNHPALKSVNEPLTAKDYY